MNGFNRTFYEREKTQNANKIRARAQKDQEGRVGVRQGTVGQNQFDLRNLIIHCPTSSGVSEHASEVSSAERVNE